MKTTVYILALFFLLAYLQSGVSAQNKTTLRGTVLDPQKKPVPFANVFLLNTTSGGTTDENGTFFFKTNLTGEYTLSVSSVGYQKVLRTVSLSGAAISFDITLIPEEVKFSEVVVTGSSFGSEKEKGLVISRIDVVTTPGGAADIFQALKTLPGLTQVSESAELYIRGGDPLESLTMIDGAAMYHPSTFESAYGGLFSNISQSMVKSMYFSSGGFSPKYGNALSGVLDIETKNQPDRMRHQLGISMANVSLTSDLPLATDKLGLYFDARQSFTRPIFWLNGGNERMIVAPVSGNISSGLVYSYSKTGRLKLFGITASDKQGVKVERAEYDGVFNGSSKNSLLNLSHSNLLQENIVIKNSFSYNIYSNRWQLGVLDLEKTDKVLSTRNDLEWNLSSSIALKAGAEAEHRYITYIGSIPQQDYDIRPDGSKKVLDVSFEGNRIGAYTELVAASLPGLPSLSLSGGMRSDFIPGLNLQWIDPRAAAAYKLSPVSSLRLGWGIYHQLPDPRLFSPVDGNPDLKPMRAEHIILSYDYNPSVENSFRVELYRKVYSSLPKENTATYYDNSGSGYANGIDVIYKAKLGSFDGWISYGYINTKRDWMDFTGLSSSSYDITHNFTLVAKYPVTQNLQAGINAKYATGRPFTPITSAIFLNDRNVYKPVYGSTNTSRYPDYARLDLRLTWFDNLFSQPFLLYIEGLNILNINNIFGYHYNEDYSAKEDIKSYFGRRTVVVGCMITLGGM